MGWEVPLCRNAVIPVHVSTEIIVFLRNACWDSRPMSLGISRTDMSMFWTSMPNHLTSLFVVVMIYGSSSVDWAQEPSLNVIKCAFFSLQQSLKVFVCLFAAMSSLSHCSSKIQRIRKASSSVILPTELFIDMMHAQCTVRQWWMRLIGAQTHTTFIT